MTAVHAEVLNYNFSTIRARWKFFFRIFTPYLITGQFLSGTIQLHLDNCIDRQTILRGHRERQHSVFYAVIQLLRCERGYRQNLRLHFWQGNAVVRPIPYMDIQSVAPVGHATGFVIDKGPSPGTKDRLTVNLQLLAHFDQALHLILRNRSICTRPNIKQEIAVTGDRLQQKLHAGTQRAWRIGHITKGAIQGVIGLPRLLCVEAANFTLRGKVIAVLAHAVAVVDNDARLQFTDHPVQLICAPEVGTLHPIAHVAHFLPRVQVAAMAEPVILASVKPEDIDLTVLSHQLADLLMALLAQLHGVLAMQPWEEKPRETPIQR